MSVKPKLKATIKEDNANNFFTERDQWNPVKCRLTPNITRV